MVYKSIARATNNLIYDARQENNPNGALSFRDQDIPNNSFTSFTFFSRIHPSLSQNVNVTLFWNGFDDQFAFRGTPLLKIYEVGTRYILRRET